MKIKSRLLWGFALLISVPGCGFRHLAQARYERGAEREYVYFVENDGSDSRLKKCDIQPDNVVLCSTQYSGERR